MRSSEAAGRATRGRPRGKSASMLNIVAARRQVASRVRGNDSGCQVMADKSFAPSYALGI